MILEKLEQLKLNIYKKEKRVGLIHTHFKYTDITDITRMVKLYLLTHILKAKIKKAVKHNEQI